MRIIRAAGSIIKTSLIKLRYGKTCTIGLRPRVSKSTEINASGMLKIGDDFSAETNTHFVSVDGGYLEIGSAVAFNRNCIVICRSKIQIGNSVEFGPNVVIYDHDHVYGYNGIISGEYKKDLVYIDDNCWIGANVTILRGTTIGEGCVIGAGCVVKGMIPPHSIVVSENRNLTIRPINTIKDSTIYTKKQVKEND